MPGLLGLINNRPDAIQHFNNAFQELSQGYKNTKDSIYSDKNIIAQRVHLGIIGEKQTPFSKNDIHIWIEGEIYNKEVIEKHLYCSFNSFSEVLRHSYHQNILSQVLSLIDGYFCAVIYDKNHGKINLISDRFGFKPLYYNKNNFAWSSELKSFRHFQNCENNLNYLAIKSFLELGHFIGNTTYFKNIEFLDAATILEYDISTESFTKYRYWNWSEIKQQNISLDESADLFFYHIKKAVQSRIKEDENNKLGITLSGGIDSRVLLSQIPKKIPAITFGTKNSRDYLIAKKVADKRKTAHVFFELNDSNWFNNKLQAIWNTDGMFNLMHMHSSPFSHQFPDYLSINFNGFAGDLTIGGGWISELNTKITKGIAYSKFGKGCELTNINDIFYNIPHEDPYYIDNRVRRFTNMGTIQNSKYFEQRKPFFENNLLQFTYSIPDEHRKDGMVYNTMIQKHLKELFWHIPTTHSIFPVGRNNSSYLKVKNKCKHSLIKMGLLPPYNWKYTNYEGWYYQTNFQNLVKELFKESILFDHNNTLSLKFPDFSQKNLSIAEIEKNLMLITIEIWFKQFFLSQYLHE
jgi:hypothetical protein